MARIGILGAGQLGQMLALAGIPLGMRFRFLDSAAGSPAGQVAEHIVADYHDGAGLKQFLEELDLVTYEFENIPLDVVEEISKIIPVYPPAMALEKSQDRFLEKSFFRTLGIPTPEFARATDPGFEFPCVLKTCRMGYDGKGQFLVTNENERSQVLKQLGDRDAIQEQYIQFERELSLLAVRARSGETKFYPLIENTHRDGILRKSIAPAQDVKPGLQKSAEEYAISILNTLDYIGVLAIEFFQVDGKLLASEMAPRVHNSGHWTIEGAVTSQFENHLRAVSGAPLGDTSPLGVCGMLNLVGGSPPVEEILKTEGAHLHLYGKKAHPRRKIGHVTFVEKDLAELTVKLGELEKTLIDDR